MRNLNNILEKGLKDQRFTLSDGERENIWESISHTLSQEGADVAAAPSKGKVWWRKPIYWSLGAAAAAVVLGLIMFKPGTQRVTPADNGSGVVAQNSPFLPKAEPMKETTLATELDPAKDRNGATTSALGITAENYQRSEERIAEENIKNKETAEEILAKEVPNIEEVRAVPTEEKPSNQTVGEDVKKATGQDVKNVSGQDEKNVSAQDAKKASDTKKKKVKEYELWGKSKYVAQNSNFSVGASSNLTNRGKLSSANAKSMRAMVAQLGYDEFKSVSAAPQITPISESSYSMPFNAGITLTYRVTDNLWVGTGITYTYLHSKYDGLLDGTKFRIKQGIHFVGVPVNLYYSVVNKNKWDFYVNGGGVVEKGVKVHYDMKTASGQTSTANTHIKGFQYSLNAGMGVEYKIGNGQFGLYAEPRAAYYFDTKDKTPKNIRTDEPFQFEVQLGVRFHLK